MAMLKFLNFRGERPILSPHKLDALTAQVAQSCRFEGGILKAIRTNTTVQAAPGGSAVDTIFYYPPNDVWLTWTSDVDVQRSMIANDSHNRVYWTGDGAPKFATATLIGSTTGPFPNDSLTLGIPAPTLTPDVVVSGTPTDPLALPDSRYYIFTYVDVYGSEGPPSPVSAMVQPIDDQIVTVSNMGTVAPVGDYAITKKRIYRTNTGSQGAIYQLVAEIDLATSSYDDSTMAEYLGDELSTAEYDMPDPNMYGLLAHPGGYYVAFAGTAIYMSEPGYPYAWPVKYQIGVDYNIVGGAVFGDTVAILTTGTPYLMAGNHPSATSLRRIEENQACLAKRGIVDLGFAVCYPSPDGLMMLSNQGIKNVTEQVFTRDQWIALKPSSFVATMWEGKYLCSYDTGTVSGTFAINPSNPESGVVYYDTVFGAAHNYLIDDYLYLRVGANIVSWDSTGVFAPYTWRSGKLQAPRPINFGVAQVRANTYPSGDTTPLRMTLYADGVRRWSGFIFDDKPFRLPAGYRASQWEIELVGAAEVYELLLGETSQDLKGA
jgi:hypothetical protein